MPRDSATATVPAPSAAAQVAAATRSTASQRPRTSHGSRSAASAHRAAYSSAPPDRSGARTPSAAASTIGAGRQFRHRAQRRAAQQRGREQRPPCAQRAEGRPRERPAGAARQRRVGAGESRRAPAAARAPAATRPCRGGATAAGLRAPRRPRGARHQDDRPPRPRSCPPPRPASRSAAAAATASAAASAGSTGCPTQARAAATRPPASAAAAARVSPRGRASGSVCSSGCGATVPPTSETSGRAAASASGEVRQRPALLRSRAQRAVDPGTQRVRQVAARAAQGRQHRADAARRRRGRAGADRIGARQRLVEHEREAVEVGPLVDPPARGLLGRHVGQRADDVAGARERFVAGEVGDAEVRELRHAGGRARSVGDDHVLRLDVAVYDAAPMGMLQRIAEREPDPQHVAVRQRALPAEHVQRAAVDQLGDQVARAGVPAGVEDRDDAGMVEPSGGQRLALGARRVAPVGGGDHLDRHGASQPLVGRGVDRAEPSGSEARAEPVTAEDELGADRCGQLVRDVHVTAGSARRRSSLRPPCHPGRAEPAPNGTVPATRKLPRRP